MDSAHYPPARALQAFPCRCGKLCGGTGAGTRGSTAGAGGVGPAVLPDCYQDAGGSSPGGVPVHRPSGTVRPLFCRCTCIVCEPTFWECTFFLSVPYFVGVYFFCKMYFFCKCALFCRCSLLGATCFCGRSFFCTCICTYFCNFTLFWLLFCFVVNKVITLTRTSQTVVLLPQ